MYGYFRLLWKYLPVSKPLLYLFATVVELTMKTIHVNGYHLGERFDLKQLKNSLAFTLNYEDPTELIYELAESAYFQCFDYGSIVFFGVKEVTQTDIINSLRTILALENSGWKSEHFKVEISEEAPYKIFFDKIVIKEINPAIAKLLMLNIGQSVALDSYIEQSNALIEETAKFCTELEERGTYSLKGKKLLQYIGRTLNLRNKIASNLYVFDSPQLTWNDEFLNVINLDLNRELDITLRHRCLQDNLDTVKENLEIFNDLHQHSHSSNLEWIIIILIAVEIAGYIIDKIF